MEPARRNYRKWIVAGIKVAILVLVAWFIRGTVLKAVAQLREQPIELDYGWLTFSGLLYLGSMVPAAMFWWLVMRSLGQRPRIVQSIMAYILGHLGKYVPGKAVVIVIRAGLVRGPEVSGTLAAVAVFVETLTMMASGAFLAAAILGAEFARYRIVLVGSIVFMVLSTVPILPPVFRRLVPMLRVGRSDPEIGRKLSGLSYGVLGLGWLMMGVMWVLMGLSLWAVLRGMGIEDLSPTAYLHRYTGAMALAIVAGFVSMIPGGLLVRDAVLAEVLGPMVPQLGPSVGVISAALLRLVWVVAELIISVILYMGLMVGRLVRRARP